MRFSMFVLAATLILASSAHAQRDWSKIDIKAEKVADGIYMLKGAGGNMGLAVGEDGAFLIDDQFAPLTDKIKAAIAEVTDRPLRFVLNTHWHPDHTGGNENLGGAGALIVGHDNVRTRMSTKQLSELMGDREAKPEGAWPVVTFSEDVTFHLNGDEIHASYAPAAHTDTDAIVHFRKANVIHAGDIVFSLMYPQIDADRGGTADVVIAACARMAEMSDASTKIIPGHCDLTDRAGVQAYHDMLVTVRDRVKKLMAEGKSLDDVKAANVTADLDEQWKKWIEPDRFVSMVYVGLEKSQ